MNETLELNCQVPQSDLARLHHHYNLADARAHERRDARRYDFAITTMKPVKKTCKDKTCKNCKRPFRALPRFRVCERCTRNRINSTQARYEQRLKPRPAPVEATPKPPQVRRVPLSEVAAIANRVRRVPMHERTVEQSAFLLKAVECGAIPSAAPISGG